MLFFACMINLFLGDRTCYKNLFYIVFVVFITGAIDYRKQVGGADSLSPGGSVIPVHPDVTFKRLPFYDIMGELLKPTSLGEL